MLIIVTSLALHVSFMKSKPGSGPQHTACLSLTGSSTGYEDPSWNL